MGIRLWIRLCSNWIICTSCCLSFFFCLVVWAPGCVSGDFCWWYELVLVVGGGGKSCGVKSMKLILVVPS